MGQYRHKARLDCEILMALHRQPVLLAELNLQALSGLYHPFAMQ